MCSWWFSCLIQTWCTCKGNYSRNIVSKAMDVMLKPICLSTFKSTYRSIQRVKNLLARIFIPDCRKPSDLTSCPKHSMEYLHQSDCHWHLSPDRSYKEGIKNPRTVPEPPSRFVFDRWNKSLTDNSHLVYSYLNMSEKRTCILRQQTFFDHLQYNGLMKFHSF